MSHRGPSFEAPSRRRFSRLALAGAARADEPGFVLQGEGGLVTALVLDPVSTATLYATTARGLFQSRDNGATWRPRGRGLDAHSVLALAIDPSAHETLYAATDTGGVFRSTDSGESWRRSSEGLDARYVGAIAVDPHRRGAIYAGTEAGRVFRSTDAGETWSELGLTTARVAVTAIAFDPATDGHDLSRDQQRGTLQERPTAGRPGFARSSR